MGRDLFRPPDPLPVSEWAARFFHVDKTSPSPGLYDPSTTPWINAILDEYPDPNLTQIVLKASAQSSKTQPAIICLAWVIANDPGPAMWVTAAGDEVRTFAKTRLRDSFEHTPPVASLLDQLGRADDNLTEINFRTMPLILNGANSPTKLQSKPERYLFLDEVRDWPEGAVDMVEKRVTFWLGLHKVFIFSTPKFKGDAFDSRFEDGDQREYHVACPACARRATMQWDQLKWDTNAHTRPGGQYHFPRLFETIRYEFPCCGATIRDDQTKRVQLAREGIWVPQNKRASPGKRSYTWNALLPPRIPWSLLVEEFLKGRQAYKEGVLKPLQDFMNQRLAKAWDEGQLVNWAKPKHVYEVRDQETEEAAAYRFFTVDVQIDHFFYVIRDWWTDGSSRLIAYGVLYSWTEVRAKQQELGVSDNLTL